MFMSVERPCLPLPVGVGQVVSEPTHEEIRELAEANPKATRKRNRRGTGLDVSPPNKGQLLL